MQTEHHHEQRYNQRRGQTHTPQTQQRTGAEGEQKAQKYICCQVGMQTDHP